MPRPNDKDWAGAYYIKSGGKTGLVVFRLSFLFGFLFLILWRLRFHRNHGRFRGGLNRFGYRCRSCMLWRSCRCWGWRRVFPFFRRGVCCRCMRLRLTFYRRGRCLMCRGRMGRRCWWRRYHLRHFCFWRFAGWSFTRRLMRWFTCRFRRCMCHRRWSRNCRCRSSRTCRFVRTHHGRVHLRMHHLWRRQGSWRPSRHVSRYRLGGCRFRRGYLDDCRHRCCQMRSCRNRCIDCLAIGCGICRCDYCDIGDIGHVGDIRLIVVDGNMHAFPDNWRCARHNGGSSANRCRYDQAIMRSRWRRHEHAFRSHRPRPGNDSGRKHGQRNIDTHGRCHKGNTRRSPETVDEYHAIAAMFVVGIDPAITVSWRMCPAPVRPDPIAFPYPIAAGPIFVIGRLRRRCFHQHRRRRPFHHDRWRLLQWRIDIDTHDRLRLWRHIVLRRRCRLLRIFLRRCRRLRWLCCLPGLRGRCRCLRGRLICRRRCRSVGRLLGVTARQ